jgi:type IV pilus assembly protein PilA
MPTWVIVLIVCVVGLVFLMGTLGALAIFGVKKYISNAKRAEATQVLGLLGKSIVRCATALDETGKPRGLPASAPPVPSDLASVSGKKYQSSPSEWSAPAYTCTSFTLTDPQYFQYEYRKVDATRGEVIAVADLDGDGAPDAKSSLTIECSPDGATCNVGPVTQ